MKTNCGYCNKEIDRKPSYLKRYPMVYCSKECRKGSMSVKSIECECGECSTSFFLKPCDLTKAVKSSKCGKIFCTKSCAATFTNKLRGREGVSTYRKRALEIHGEKCNRCGYYTYKDILQVHHIDRDRNNGSVLNLEVLCPTCHNEEHYVKKDGVFWNKNKDLSSSG